MAGPKSGPPILVFPPAVSLAAPLLAILLEWLIPLDLLPPFGLSFSALLGVLILLASGWLAVAGAAAFKAAGTNVDPRQPALHLVRSGPFRWTRNPMYSGMVLFQVGLGLAASLDWALLFAPIVMVILHFAVVLREEAYLTGLFGEPYRAYMRQTRRWVGRPKTRSG